MTTTTSPLIWLKDLCTHFDWLHTGAQALAEGRPLPEPENVPDHAIGEIIRAFQRVDETLRAHRVETEKIRLELQNREQELHVARSESHNLLQDIEHARGTADEARRVLEDRQRQYSELESQWANERSGLEQRLGESEQRVRALTERLKDHAQTLHAVASDLSNVTG